MSISSQAIFVGALAILVIFAVAASVLADEGHMEDEPHGTGAIALSDTVDRSSQLPSVILGFVIGLVVGAIAVKFFTKSA